MFNRILKAIESKRGMDSLFFKTLFFLKDLFWIAINWNLTDLKLYFYTGDKPKKYLNFWIKNYISGAFFVFTLKDQTIVIPTFLGFNGEIEALEGYFKEYVPEKGDTVVDAGAFHGLVTIVLSLLVENGKVISIEPDPKSFLILKKNMGKLKLNNVILVNRALFNKNKKIKFNVFGRLDSSVFEAGDFKVDAVTLDSLTEKFHNKINFIKMDIEGSEIEALEGAKKLLKSKNIHLAIASYHIRNGEKTCFELNKIFSSLGYKSYTGFNKHLTTYAYKK